MDYFEAMASSSFKTAADGRQLFFPWRAWGRGYVIGSELGYARLRRQITIYNIAAIVLIVGTLIPLGFVAGFAMAAALMVFYLAWTRYLLRGLQPSDERLSLRESMTSQARAQGPVLLWIGEVGSIAFVAAGIFTLVFDSGNWLTATASIVIFSLCATSFMFMLVLRRGDR
jgi:hypothetical protein